MKSLEPASPALVEAKQSTWREQWWPQRPARRIGVGLIKLAIVAVMVTVGALFGSLALGWLVGGAHAPRLPLVLMVAWCGLCVYLVFFLGRPRPYEDHPTFKRLQ